MLLLLKSLFKLGHNHLRKKGGSVKHVLQLSVSRRQARISRLPGKHTPNKWDRTCKKAAAGKKYIFDRPGSGRV